MPPDGENVPFVHYLGHVSARHSFVERQNEDASQTSVQRMICRFEVLLDLSLLLPAPSEWPDQTWQPLQCSICTSSILTPCLRNCPYNTWRRRRISLWCADLRLIEQDHLLSKVVLAKVLLDRSNSCGSRLAAARMRGARAEHAFGMTSSRHWEKNPARSAVRSQP